MIAALLPLIAILLFLLAPAGLTVLARRAIANLPWYGAAALVPLIALIYPAVIVCATLPGDAFLRVGGMMFAESAFCIGLLVSPVVFLLSRRR